MPGTKWIESGSKEVSDPNIERKALQLFTKSKGIYAVRKGTVQRGRAEEAQSAERCLRTRDTKAKQSPHQTRDSIRDSREIRDSRGLWTNMNMMMIQILMTWESDLGLSPFLKPFEDCVKETARALFG